MAEALVSGPPRLLGFASRVPRGRASRALGWPCHAFRVTVPVRPVGRLNILEMTTLRLLANARFDEHALADAMCLDRSLVRLILGRLRDLGMLDRHNEVVADGRAYVSRAGEDAFDYEVRWVFRERVTGKILPVVLAGELRYEDLARWNAAKRLALIRRRDRPLPVHLLPHQDSGMVRPPMPADIVAATRRHQELTRQYAALRVGVSPCSPVVRLDQLNVDPNPERVFLRCTAVIPDAADDYRIADPFGYGYSEVLFQAYEELRERDEHEAQLVRELRASAVTMRQARPDENARTDEAKAAVLAEVSEAVRSYGELFGKLQQAERELQKSHRPPRNAAEDAHFRYHVQQAAQSLSEAIEIALATVSTQWRPAASEVLLSSAGRVPADNAELLARLAERLGLKTDDIGGLLHVAAGRVRGLRQGDVDLQALVAVSLAAADEAEDHPVRRLVSRCEGWLEYVWRLKRMRDVGAHGQTREAGAKDVAWMRTETYRTLTILLPSLERTVTGAAPTHAAPSTDRTHDERRLATASLEKHFGVRWYAHVDTDSAELFVQVELAANRWRHQTGPDEIDVARTVNDLASLVQALAHASQPTRDPAPLDPDHAPQAVAARRAVEAGWTDVAAGLPPVFARVNPTRLAQALQGRSPSLNTTIMAMLVVAPTEWLRGLATRAPGFLALCARLLDTRKHGNRPVFMTAAEALALKDDVYQVCIALMEA